MLQKHYNFFCFCKTTITHKIVGKGIFKVIKNVVLLLLSSPYSYYAVYIGGNVTLLLAYNIQKKVFESSHVHAVTTKTLFLFLSTICIPTCGIKQYVPFRDYSWSRVTKHKNNNCNVHVW